MTRPEKVSSKAMRIHPVEFRRYRVHATIDAAFREGDGDLHVVIHDRANDGTTAEADTMIAEFPDATCAPQQASTYADVMGKARDAFKNLGQTLHRLSGQLRLAPAAAPARDDHGHGLLGREARQPADGPRPERPGDSPGAEVHPGDV